MAGAELAPAPPRERRDRARIAGVDEAGRGPLAGPVVAAAVILDPRRRIRGLADSKLLTAKERERLALLIRARALAFGIGWADRDEIDCLNILEATLLAMRRALLALPVCPTHVQVDGNRCPWLADLPLPCTLEAIVRGDALVAAISAASILAKVHRDAIILSRGAQGRSQADRRSRPAGRGGGRAAAAADASDAAVSVAGRLPESHAPREPRLPRRTGARHGAHRARLALAGRPRGPHRPLLRHRGRHRSGAHFRARARRRARARCVAGAPPRALLSRAATPRQALRGDLHRWRGGACRPARRAGGGHQRRALPRARAVRVARGARLHPRRHAPRRHRPGAPLFAPAVPAHAAGDGGPLRRPARGARQLRRDRAPLEPPAHSRGSAAAAVSAARRGEHRGVPARGSRARPRGPLRRKLGRPAPLSRAARSRARRDLPDGLRGLLPHRRRLYPLGARARRAGGPRARLGGGLAGRLQPQDHRSRSDPLRLALRALPQPRARLAA